MGLGLTLSFSHRQTWSHDGSVVYSVSKDGCVGRLVSNKSSSTKFRPGGGKRRPLYSVALLPEEAVGPGGLLVGSFAQVMWVDLDTQVVLRTFGGHVGAVGALHALAVSPGRPPYALSAGSGEKDRMVSVWRLEAKGEEEELRPEALLNVSEPVGWVTAAAPAALDEEEEGDILVGCVSRTGVLRCFEVETASKRKKKSKAVRPKITVQVKRRPYCLEQD